jgi:hypothetical protein
MKAFGFIGLILVLAAGMWAPASAQDARLVGRLPDADRARVDSILVAAQSAGLPTEPLVDRALEGAAKGASPDAIIRAVSRLAGELRTAQVALGRTSTNAELGAGASALRAGATADDLAALRARRAGDLTVAAAVLAELVAVGVPSDTAIGAVLALAPSLADGDYVAFRRHVERDIELGASPVSALGVRLRIAGDMALDANSPGSVPTPTGGQPKKRKP